MAYCTIADLPKVCADIANYDGKRTLPGESFVEYQSRVYVYYDSGAVAVMYRDGTDLGDSYTKVPDGSAPGQWWYDSDADALYVSVIAGASITDYSWDCAAQAWTDAKTAAISDGAEELESYLDKRFPRPLPTTDRAGNSRTYDRHIIKANALLACISLIEAHDPLAEILPALKTQVYGDKGKGDAFNGILTDINSGAIKLSFEVTPSDFNGEILSGATNSSTTGKIYSPHGKCSKTYDKIKVEIVTGGTITLNSNNTMVTYKTTDADGNTAVAETVIEPGLVGIGSGLRIRFTPGVYVAGDYWYVEATGTASTTGTLGSMEGYR